MVLTATRRKLNVSLAATKLTRAFPINMLRVINIHPLFDRITRMTEIIKKLQDITSDSRVTAEPQLGRRTASRQKHLHTLPLSVLRSHSDGECRVQNVARVCVSWLRFKRLHTPYVGRQEAMYPTPYVVDST